MLDWVALLENDARLDHDLPDEKFEVVAKMKRRRKMGLGEFERVLTVFGVMYEGSYMTTALERFEEQAANYHITLRSPDD